MAQNSKIEWTKHTANLWHGCAKVHEGCDHCYAEALSHRWGNDVWGNDKPRKVVKSVWSDLSKFQKLAKAANEIHSVFVGSMMDIFEKPMQLINNDGIKLTQTTDDLRKWFFGDIIPSSPNLLFLLLTKRPSNINKFIPESWKTLPPTNVMFGCSPVNQETADKLIPQLLQVRGRKFLSIEPQLDLVTLNYQWLIGSPEHEGQIDWVIVGGESGHHRRPFNCEWARIIRDQCKRFIVPFFMKQIDKVQPIPDDLMIRQFPN